MQVSRKMGSLGGGKDWVWPARVGSIRSGCKQGDPEQSILVSASKECRAACRPCSTGEVGTLPKVDSHGENR